MQPMSIIWSVLGIIWGIKYLGSLIQDEPDTPALAVALILYVLSKLED
jgi:hypothetical protein